MDIFEKIQDIRINKNFEDSLEDSKIIKKLLKEEQEARKKLLLMLKRGQVRTADDFYRATLLFQHDDKSLKSYALAIALSTISYLLGERWGKSLSAAAIDRFLLSIHQKQLFGTNFEKLDNTWKMAPWQEGIPDKLRKEYDIPPLKKLQRELHSLNNFPTKH